MPLVKWAERVQTVRMRVRNAVHACRGQRAECGGQMGQRGDSPHQPQRDRDPADVSGTEQVTDVVGLPPLSLFFLRSTWENKQLASRVTHLEVIASE